MTFINPLGLIGLIGIPIIIIIYILRNKFKQGLFRHDVNSIAYNRFHFFKICHDWFTSQIII